MQSSLAQSVIRRSFIPNEMYLQKYLKKIDKYLTISFKDDIINK